MYTPDNWVVIKFKGDNPHYRVLAGWSGGYLDGDRWRMNSGITGVTEDLHNHFFEGVTGSVYECYKDAYCFRKSTAGVWEQLQEIHGDKVELMDKDTDWLKMDWNL